MDYFSVKAAGLLEEWKMVREELENLFRIRNQTSTKALMEKGIDLFIQFLALTNDKSESIPHNLQSKPVNLEERLEFIIARPNLYHSFCQLSELMTEQEKLYVKNKIKKTSRTNA